MQKQKMQPSVRPHFTVAIFNPNLYKTRGQNKVQKTEIINNRNIFMICKETKGV
jgi:hypothetical protein